VTTGSTSDGRPAVGSVFSPEMPLPAAGSVAEAVAVAAAVTAAAPGSGPGEPSRSRTGRIWWKSNNQTLANQYSKDGNRASTFWVEYKTVNRRVAAAAEAQLAGQPVRCDCGLEVLRLTSRSEKNPNRDFMCCPKPRDDASRCDCFVWADEVAAHLTQQSA
jgi:hypothetical protein